MSSLAFTVYGSPIAQPRVKSMGFMKNGHAMSRVYEPGAADSPARQWKHDIKIAAAEQLKANGDVELWSGPVSMQITLYLPRPQNLYRKKDADGRIPHAGGKDIDNLYKAIADAMNGIVYRDDKQIYCAIIMKFYHEKKGRPRAEIALTVERMADTLRKAGVR
jgi:Holliday junction resolvase RusA-like endonuclease